jgi:peroxiredoxin Q/BCP
MSLKVGDHVPDFTLPDQDGKATSLSELLAEGCVVLYFYPKDDTPGCTAEACSFRDEHKQLAEAGVRVVGVSSDDVESHRRFAEELKTWRTIPFESITYVTRPSMNPSVLGTPNRLRSSPPRSESSRNGSRCLQLRTRQHVESALAAVCALAERDRPGNQ